jgi:1,4-alpha-glucan branching enzyme
MQRLRNILVITLISSSLSTIQAQTAADSVTVTFCAYNDASTPLFVRGEFNAWGQSAMTYNSSLGAWIMTYDFKTKQTGRNLADSAIQYKFYRGSSWFPDPLNPEQNSADNNNSVIRLTKLFWFEINTRGTSTEISRITAGICHANSDTITKAILSSGLTKTSVSQTIDETSSYNSTLRILDINLLTPLPKSNYLRLVAYNNLGDSIVYQQGGFPVQIAALPSYAKHGVTLPSTASNDSVTFRLQVPGKGLVLLRIALKGTLPTSVDPVPLRMGPDSVNWWTNLKLAEGDYEYVYELDNGKLIYDPFGRTNGTNGTGFTVGAAGLSADDYVWGAKNYVKPPKHRLIIYELHLGEFAGAYFGKAAGTATFKDMAKMFGYLDSLGINAVELMPVNDYGNIGKSGFGWGYDVAHHFALEPGYGTSRDFKEMVDSAHSHNIAVIVDVVYNHINSSSPLWQMCQDVAANPYIKAENDLRYNEDQGSWGFLDMDHWTVETQEYIYEALKMWLDAYKVDGFRFDYTQGIGWNKDEPTKGIFGWANRIANEYHDAYLIAEHLPESPAMIFYSKLTGNGYGMTSGWHDSFHDKMYDERMENVPISDLQNLAIDLGAFPGNDTPATPASYATRTEPVNATVNHDEHSLIYEMIKGIPLAEAQKRDRLYGTFMFTSLGIPMLWEGMEFGEPRGWESDGQKLSYRPVQWNLLSTDAGKVHYNYYQKLVRQRIYNPAIYNGQLRLLKAYSSGVKVIVWGFEDIQTGAKIMVVANMWSMDQTVTDVPWLASGIWYDVFDQSQYTASATTIPSFIAPGYTAKVYSNKSDKELGIPTSVHNHEQMLPKDYAIYQNYPNPFNPSTTIRYALPHRTYVSLNIYDIMGNLVQTLYSGEHEPGTFSIVWNASRYPSGTYFVRMQSEQYTRVKKVLLLK